MNISYKQYCKLETRWQPREERMKKQNEQTDKKQKNYINYGSVAFNDPHNGVKPADMLVIEMKQQQTALTENNRTDNVLMHVPQAPSLPCAHAYNLVCVVSI